MRRFDDRFTKQPHTVRAFKNGVEIGTFNLPATDTRFVKGDDLILMAWEKATTTPTQRYNDDIFHKDWDTLKVFWCWSVYSCNRQGQRIQEDA